MEEIFKTRVGSYALILNKEKTKVALVRKARGGYLGKLDMPGGGLELNETPEEALKREVLEEAGINVLNYKLLDATATHIRWEMEPNLYENLHQVGILYIVVTEELALKENPDGLDSDGAKWYLLSDLHEEELTPFTIHALKKCGLTLNSGIRLK